MNAVHNIAATEVTSVIPTGRAKSKPVSASFRDIQECIMKNQMAKGTPAKAEKKDSELAAEQGMTAAAPTVVQNRADTVGNGSTNQDTLQAVDALRQQISKCCDFTQLTDEIADILEGFGLLKSSGDTVELTQEGMTLLQNMMNSIMNAENPAETVVFTVAGKEAGMLNTAIPDDVQQKLQLLIKEYVCSLENANNINSAGASGSTAVEDAILSAAPQAEQASFLSLSLDTEPLNKDAKVTLPPAGENDQVSANETTAQKDPMAQLIQALAEAKKGVTQEEPVQPEPAAASETKPGHAAIGSAFSLRQPELLQNGAGPDIPSPVVTQADMAENISNIVKEMSFRSEENVQEFSISLKPEHLGELVIKLTKGPEGLLAQIKAADVSTKGLIQNEVTALTEQLKGKGIEVRQIEVLYEAPAFTTDLRQDRGRRDADANPYRIRNSHISGIEETYGTMVDPASASALLSMDSSVEYQA